MTQKPNTTTDPIEAYAAQTAPRITIAPSYTDPIEAYAAQTAAVYVHQDLTEVLKPWETEEHVSPIDDTQRFGDVESWVAYVHRFAGQAEHAPLLTWSERGLRAVLDYHSSTGDRNRCDWIAEHPFVPTEQWLAWAKLADGRPRDQKGVVEALEDLADDIKDPDAGSLMGLLRILKATSKVEGNVELREDGTGSITYTKNTTVQAGGVPVDIPSSIRIEIPVFKGHTVMADVLDVNGKPTGAQRPAPVPYGLTVRIRVDSDEGKVWFRLSRPQAETVFESALADRIATTIEKLGEGFTLLRATA